MGRGPARCTSIESRIASAGARPQKLIMEAEGVAKQSVYLNGAFTSLPVEAQALALKTVGALTTAQFTKVGYAVEYDVVCSNQLSRALELARSAGVFIAGQLAGSTGYEEACVQGWVAGVNAARRCQNMPPIALSFTASFAGLLTFRMTQHALKAPYSMACESVPNRARLKQRNASLRLLASALAANTLLAPRAAKRLE